MNLTHFAPLYKGVEPRAELPQPRARANLLRLVLLTLPLEVRGANRLDS